MAIAFWWPCLRCTVRSLNNLDGEALDSMDCTLKGEARDGVGIPALQIGGPLVVGVDASRWDIYGSGVFDGCDQDATINHAAPCLGLLSPKCVILLVDVTPRHAHSTCKQWTVVTPSLRRTHVMLVSFKKGGKVAFPVIAAKASGSLQSASGSPDLKVLLVGCFAGS